MGYTEAYCGTVPYVSQQGVPCYSKHYLFVTWRMMSIRCYDTRHKAYQRYGGRGILVCDSWRFDNPFGFSNFLNDMGERPVGHTLDRINNDLNYCPENCKWSTRKEQQNNIGVGKRNNSGALGVQFSESKQCWVVHILLNGKQKLLGHFNTNDKQSAIDAYEKVKQLKISEGDDSAITYVDSIKDLTPTGKRKRRNKSSKYYGVAAHKNGKWRAFSNEYVDGKLKQISLGVYVNEDDAYQAVLSRMKELGKLD
jgi:hypothetical protein